MLQINDIEEELLNGSQLEDITSLSLWPKDFTLDDNLPALGFPPNISICKSPRANLGSLDILPLELLQGVLSQVDLCTLMGFRSVNRRARLVLDSMPQYKAITTHARNVLWGIFCIEAARWISCEAVYEKLCTAACEQCGDFGGYLYILTCKRVCLVCLSEDKVYLPVQRSHAIRKFGVNRRILDTLPSIRSIPGMYSPYKKKRHDRLVLVDSESAYRAGVTLHGSVSAMELYVSKISTQNLDEYNRILSQARVEGSGSTGRRPRRPRTEDIPDDQSENPMRFMAIVRIPWFNRASQQLERGFHCNGCQKQYNSRALDFRRKFTVTSFNEHLRQFGGLQNGKHLLL